MRLALGVDYDLPPVPLMREHTTFFPAGAIMLGVEYRLVTEDVIAGAYTEEQRQATVVDGAKPGLVKDDRGVSIHVCDAASAQEHLRFDCFDDDPHYHYIVPGIGNTAIAFDETALGDMVEWAIASIGGRAAEMLARAGAPHLAAGIDQRELRAALSEVRQAAQLARHKGATMWGSGQPEDPLLDQLL